MKKIFFLLFFLWSAIAGAECKKHIDPSKVIIFVDTNLASREIPTAEAGACARGERLIVIPKDYKNYDQLIIELRDADKDFMKCVNSKLLTSVCDLKAKKLNEIGEKLRGTILNYSALLTKELEQLKKTKAVVTSFIISGHDGGGNFGGEKGELNRDEIEKVFKNYPEVNKVESALLLGCYTGVKYEVKSWLSIFPNLHLVGGYDSTAPLSDKPAGLEYIQELLANEKKLVDTTDQKSLGKKLFNNIKSISELHAGIYIKTQCSVNTNANEFYYGSQTSEKGLEFLDSGECQKKEIIKEIRELEPRFKKYTSGEVEPPKDSTNGDLRKIYNRARKLEHCLVENKSSINLNAVFNLLFFNGIKDSFSDFYKDDLKKAEAILKDQSPLALKEVWVPTTENLKNKTRKQILDNIYKTYKLAATAGIPAKAATTLAWLGKIANQHFVSFQNPFSWHDHADKVEVPPDYSPLHF